MSTNEEVLQNMDKAAEAADEELKKISKEHIQLIADWWRRNYLKAGHKRLAKTLLTYSTKKETY